MGRNDYIGLHTNRLMNSGGTSFHDDHPFAKFVGYTALYARQRIMVQPYGNRVGLTAKEKALKLACLRTLHSRLSHL